MNCARASGRISLRAAWAVVPVLLKVVTSDEGAASVQSCCASGFVWSSLVDEAQPSSVKNRADMAERLPTEGSRKVTPARVAPEDDRRAFWRSVAVSVLRVSVTIAVLGAVYALAPLGRRVDGSVVAELSLSVAILIAVTVWEFRNVSRSTYPEIRAVEAVDVTLPL